MDIDASIVSQYLSQEQQPLPKLLNELSPIHPVRITILPRLGGKIAFGRERGVNVDEFDFAFDPIFDYCILIDVTRLEELKVVTLHNEILPVSVIGIIGWSEKPELVCSSVDLSSLKGADQLKRRPGAEGSGLVQDGGFGPFSLVFNGGYPGVLQGLEIETGIEARKQLLGQFSGRLKTIVQALLKDQKIFIGKVDFGH
jgi:hypothetical protein